MILKNRTALIAIVAVAAVVVVALGFFAGRNIDRTGTGSGLTSGLGEGTKPATDAGAGTKVITQTAAPQPVDMAKVPEAPPAASKKPAEKGEKLAKLTTPPTESLWGIPAKSYKAGQEATLTFEPYGFGPASSGPSVVARVLKAEVAKGTKLPELEGKNLVMALGNLQVTVGGQFKGVVTTVAEGDVVTFRLKSAEPIKR